MDAAAELLLMQVTDPTFPIGAYAHSYGLETYVQRGAVAGPGAAAAYVARQIAGPLCYTELLGMRLAYERAQAGDLPGLARLEALLAAYKAPAELREASRKLAARFCRTAAPLLADAPDEGAAGEKDGAAPGAAAAAGADAGAGGAVAALGAGTPGGPLAGAAGFSAYAQGAAAHMLNSAYGAFACAAGIPLEPLMRRYLYAQVSAMVTTCVKAVPLSQTAGQRILRGSYAAQGEAVARALAAPEEDFCRAAPGFDVRAIEHETLYSRLFMS